MKLIKNTIYALSMLSVMGLWSCSNDEMLPGNTIVGDKVPLTITVSRGIGQTRTTVSENEEAGLNSIWKKDDVIGLYNSNGEKAGELTLKKGEENKSASIFEGYVTGGSGTYNLWYFGQPDADGKYAHIDFTTNPKKPKLTLATTPMTEVGQLAEYDIMSKSAEIVVSDNKASVKEDVIMAPRMAMARFSFKNLPEKQSGTLTISNNDATYTTLYTAGNISLTEHGIGHAANAYKDYVIEGVSTDNDLYLALIPEVNYKLCFKFEVDDKVYTCQLNNSTKLKAGLYYNNGLNEDGDVKGYELSFAPEEKVMAELHLWANFEGADPEEIVLKKEFIDGKATFDLSLPYTSYLDEDGKTKLPIRVLYDFLGWNENEDAISSGIGAITIDTPDCPRQDYYAVWKKVDQSLNPLSKWAESNLVYNKSTKTSSLAGNSSIGGSLYQWGRNYGFTDYKDARGTYNSKLGKWTGYVICDKQISSPIYSGTGKPFINSAGELDGPSMTFYSTVAELKEDTERWVMNVNTNKAEDDTSVDYWIWDGGGSDWGTRAIAQGYATSTPCPTDDENIKWRLPKVADFKEILPANEINTTESLSNSLNGKTEIKKLTDTSRYAIRWTKNSIGITIQALMISNILGKDDLSKIDWTDETVVVKRVFPFTGAIRSTFAVQPASGYDFYLNYIASPLPLGDISYGGNVWEYSVKQGYYTYIFEIYYTLWNIKRDHSNLYGAYWASDSNDTFTFVENSGWITEGIEKQKSQFRMVTQKRHNAYAIRCVKDN